MEGRRSRSRNKVEVHPRQRSIQSTQRSPSNPNRSQLSPAALLEISQHQQTHAPQSGRMSGAQRCEAARRARMQAHNQTIDKCVRYLLAKQWPLAISTLRNIIDYGLPAQLNNYQGMSIFSNWEELIRKEAPIR